MTTSARLMKVVFLVLIVIAFTISPAIATAPEECSEETTGPCVNKAKAFSLKITSIVAILVTSMIGVTAPLFSKSVPFLHPDGNVFTIVKCFASGIILGTGFMHVLPDSFEMLSSICLPEEPWHQFPFTGLFAMFSALVTLAIDSVATTFFSRRTSGGITPGGDNVDHERAGHGHGHSHGHGHGIMAKADDGSQQLLRYRVIAMVLELGIIVHSVVIGLSLGATNNTCTIKGLVVAICFHQMFEGMGLGGSILQAEYSSVQKFTMAFFFAITTPFGIALGMVLANVYRDNSPTALITVGILNACSAGLLMYMALVDLLAAEFMGPKLQGSISLQAKSFIAAMIGCSGMAILAKWA